jgi:AcrR family transcriptional regulator
MAQPVTEAPGESRQSPLYPKLRPRPNGPSRLCGATIEAVASRGYANTSVAELCRLAGVSKRTFYERFENKDACFLATYDNVIACVTARMSGAQRSAQDWETGVRGALEVLVRAVADRPKAARLVLLVAPYAGPVARVHRERTRRRLERFVASAFARAPHETSLPPLVVSGVVYGVEHVIRQWLRDDCAENPSSLASQLAEWMLSYAPLALPVPVGGSSKRLGSVRVRAQMRVGSERARILRATSEIVAREGYAQLSSARVARQAGVTEEVLRASYENMEDCFLDALDVVGAEALIFAARAARSRGEGPSGVFRAIAALMEHVAGDAVLRSIAFREILAAGLPAIERGERILLAFTHLLAEGLPAYPSPSPVQVEATIWAVWGVVRHHVIRDTSHMLPGLTEQAVYLTLAPLVGAETAIRMIRDPDAA